MGALYEEKVLGEIYQMFKSGKWKLLLAGIYNVIMLEQVILQNIHLIFGCTFDCWEHLLQNGQGHLIITCLFVW